MSAQINQQEEAALMGLVKLKIQKRLRESKDEKARACKHLRMAAATFCMMNDRERKKLRDERKQIMQNEEKAKRIEVQGNKGLREGKEATADLFFKAAEKSSKKEWRCTRLRFRGSH